MSKPNDMSEFKPEAPTKSESNSFTVVLGVSNLAPFREPGLPSCRSVSYTTGEVADPTDNVDDELPTPFSPGSVRTLKNRLRSRVADSAFLRDGDV